MKRIIAIISCFCLLVAGGYAQQERSESILCSLKVWSILFVPDLAWVVLLRCLFLPKSGK